MHRAGSYRADSHSSVPTGKKHLSHSIWENFKAIIGAVLIFLVIRTFFVEAYRIPSGSMKPALLIGDWLFVNKLVYGPHIPLTHVNLPGYAEPKRGDIVVFQSPPQPDEAARGQDSIPTLVKRVIGLAGDTLFMRNAVLYVNGVEARYNTYPETQPDSRHELFVWQKSAGLKQSRFGPAPSDPTHDNWGPLVVPPGHLFMMGDNRYNSKDSRYWGFVPRENLRGQPLFVYYSYNADDSDRPLPFITDIRWSRIGHWIR